MLYEPFGRFDSAIYIACSGGPDSMALLHCLAKKRFKEDFTAIHINHGTEMSNQYEELVTKFCEDYDINLVVHRIKKCPEGNNAESYWRTSRNDIFHSLAPCPVFTGHNLDDVVETWMLWSTWGSPKLMPVRNRNIHRPLILTTKKYILEYCEINNVPYIVDPTNIDGVSNARSIFRVHMLPLVLKLNPGIHKMIWNKLKFVESRNGLNFKLSVGESYAQGF